MWGPHTVLSQHLILQHQITPSLKCSLYLKVVYLIHMQHWL